jgi:hypothetical protein
MKGKLRRGNTQNRKPDSGMRKADLKLVRFPIDSCAPAHFDLSVFPSMSRAARRLHSLVAYPGDFTFHVARPGRSVHSRAESSAWTAAAFANPGP